MNSSKVIALTAFDIALTQLKLAGADTNHRSFRVKNLTPEEVLAFVDVWKNSRNSNKLKGIDLKITENIQGRIASEFLAEDGKTITYYRNHIKGGLVYVETKPQSDEQGLQNIFTLHDGNFLDKSFDVASDSFFVDEKLITNAWSVFQDEVAVPSMLLVQLKLVCRCLPSPALRKFVEFLCSVVSAYPKAAVDRGQVDDLIGKYLVLLDMFPDSRWSEGGDAKRIERRFSLNLGYAELVNGGADVDIPQLIRRVPEVQFKGIDQKPLESEVHSEYQRLCSDYLKSQQVETRAKIPFYIFSQLFLSESKGVQLGDRVLEDIEAADSDRVSELVELDVVAGLNVKSAEDARRFLLSDSDSSVPLHLLLRASTRRAVERLAQPSVSRFANIFEELVEAIKYFEQEALTIANATELRVDVMDSNPKEPNPTLGLFAFLYSKTLLSIVEETSTNFLGIRLTVDPSLVQQGVPPELVDDSGSDDEQDDESDETGGALIWRPIRIRFALLHSDGSETELPGRREWLPHDSDLEMLVLVYLFVRSKSPHFRAVGQSVIVPKRADFGLLLNDIVSRRVPEEVLLHEPQQPNDLSVFKELVVARQHLLASFDRDGLCIESIADYIDFYSTWISESRVALTPDGVRRADVSCLLETDMISVGDSVRWMLLTHPIRLKWFSRYLIEARRLIIAALSSELSLSTAQSVFYTRWLSNCSPEQQPPVYASGDGTVVFPRETVGYCTQYVPRDTGVLSSRSNSAGIGRVARQMTAYLSAHPYKEDGLAVLLYLPDDVRICEAIAHAIKSSSSREAALQFIVVSPRKDWIKFSRAAQQVADRSRLDLDNRLFPRFNLQFLEPDVFIREVGAGDLKVDISVVTHLMRNNVVLQEQTILPSGVSGSFDPLLDNPVHLRETSGGEALSLSMRPGPDISDLLLDSFQTTIVRHFRQKAVSEDQPENTDFFELAVDFQPTSKLFNSLHRVSHWVITLERHITRQQIEKLETNPEILSIEEGVGGISDSTLIVSSNAGKDLIVSRLTRKLQSLLYKTRYAGLADPLLKQVSEYVYESTRKLAPRLALKAMGVSWVTEEMLGLMMAKSKCNLSSAQSDASISALSTLSLDEHARWFGGSGETRPDFVNILFSIDHEDNLRVSIEVVEAKFRQDYVKHGVLQVQEGIKFFEEVLTNVTRVDSALWRQQIIRAIGAANRDLLQVSGSSVLRDSKGLPAKIAEKFKTGNFICGDVRGLFSICLAAETDAPHTSEFDGKVEVSRSTICDLLEQILRDISVDPPEFNSSPAEGIPSSLQSGEGIKAAGSDDHSNTARPLQSETVTSEATKELPSGNPVDTKSTLGSKGKMSQVELQRMYQQIIETLDDHSIRVSVVPAEDEPIVEGPASIVFKVLPASNVDPSRLAAKAEALKLKLRLEANQHISFRTVRGYSNIDVPKLPEQRYFIDAAALWSRAESQTGSLVAPIGENGTGEIVVIDFSDSNSPHLLIGGTTGSGKSEALNVILYGLMKFYSPAELRLLLIDPKGTEMLDIQGSKYLESEIGWIDEDAISILERAVSEMQLRYERLRDARVRTIAEFNAKCVASEKLPWWVIVLDEYQDLTADVENKKLIEAHLKRLAAKARAAGIHLIIATQKPSGDVISTNLRSNLPAQIALRVRSQIESRVIMDESGAELLNGRGDAYFKSAKGLIRVQCAYVAPKDKKHILARDT